MEQTNSNSNLNLTPPDPTFSNPYEGCHKSNEEPTRFNVDVDQREYEFIKLIRPTKGTMVITINTLFHKLVLECRRRGILDISRRKDFEHFIAHCTIAMPSELNGTTERTYARPTVPTPAPTATPVESLANIPGSSIGVPPSNTSGPDVRGTTPGTNPNSSTTPNQQPVVPSGGKGKSTRRK